MIRPIIKQRHQAALEELEKLLQDRTDFPINYNHYFTDIIHKKRQERLQIQLGQHADVADKYVSEGFIDDEDVPHIIRDAVSKWGNSVTSDMEKFSCEEALDSLLAIYKVRNGLRSNAY